MILATGGAAALWSRTTNPPGSFGSGLLLARAAGAELADLEFVQFHPTAVIGVKGREGFLVTEAIRGEGATLHDAGGERFVDELAPRDAVAQAIHSLLRGDRRARRRTSTCAAIDPRASRTSSTRCARPALDPATERIPVAPASHYVMGGIATDLDGRSTVPGLYAVGEAACTGLHGANRLASNSLSECFVFGRRAALAGLDEPAPATPLARPAGRGPRAGADPRDPRRDVARRRAGARRAEGLRGAARATRIRSPGSSPRRALAREETRGAHARARVPRAGPATGPRHSVIPASADALARFSGRERTWLI